LDLVQRLEYSTNKAFPCRRGFSKLGGLKEEAFTKPLLKVLKDYYWENWGPGPRINSLLEGNFGWVSQVYRLILVV